MSDSNEDTGSQRTTERGEMRRPGRVLALVAIHLAWTLRLCAQAPPGALPSAGLLQDRPAPGEHRAYDKPRHDAILGGRPGSQRPRVPINTRPGGVSGKVPHLPAPTQGGFPSRAAAVPDAWAILFEIDEQGPPQGLMWEQAVERLVHNSIVLRARALDIPQAQADVLTAGMHANPIVYFDRQLIGYQPYNTTTNPGGPSQYDLNVAYPVDLSHKRQARVDVACSAQRVVEALYQDAVRQEVDHLARAYVDVLAAQLALRTIEDGLGRIDLIYQQHVAGEHPDAHEAECQRRQIMLQRHTLNLARIEAESVLRGSKRNLALVLNLSTERSAALELRGSVRDKAPPPPPLAQLMVTALANRPDLAAYRLGARRAGADVRLSKANVLPDVYLLYQPFTYQDNSPFNAPSSRSWAAGATVVVPLFDRNQGNIRRAGLNAQQSRLEAQAIEQRVRADVEAAYDEYQSTRQGIQQIEQRLVPDIHESLGESLKKFRDGQLDAASYLYALRDLDDLGRQYRELLIRHRRSMLALNTAVGVRVLP